jgi:hypothetical protein
LGKEIPCCCAEDCGEDVARAGIRRKGTRLNRGPGLAETAARVSCG